MAGTGWTGAAADPGAHPFDRRGRDPGHADRLRHEPEQLQAAAGGRRTPAGRPAGELLQARRPPAGGVPVCPFCPRHAGTGAVRRRRHGRPAHRPKRVCRGQPLPHRRNGSPGHRADHYGGSCARHDRRGPAAGLTSPGSRARLHGIGGPAPNPEEDP